MVALSCKDGVNALRPGECPLDDQMPNLTGFQDLATCASSLLSPTQSELFLLFSSTHDSEQFPQTWANLVSPPRLQLPAVLMWQLCSVDGLECFIRVILSLSYSGRSRALGSHLFQKGQLGASNDTSASLVSKEKWDKRRGESRVLPDKTSAVRDS